MDIYFAGVESMLTPIKEYASKFPLSDLFVLESFFYARKWTVANMRNYGKFLLDSGAFTFFSSGKDINWEEYSDRYADFIIHNNVSRFFELDIDPLVGYERVRTLRRRLESKVGRQAIPVWHKTRGKDDFLRMCDEYKDVAIGGIVSKEIKSGDYKYLPWFIDKAHKAGAKIHGLGFTNHPYLPICHFDSVDSTSWGGAARFGAAFRFTGSSLECRYAPENCRACRIKELYRHNLEEWIKYQKYAQTHF